MDNSMQQFLLMLKGILPEKSLEKLMLNVDIDKNQLFRQPNTVMHDLLKCISRLEDQVDKASLMDLMYKNSAEAWALWAQQEIEDSKKENAKLNQLPGGIEAVQYIFQKMYASGNREAIVEEIRAYIKEPKIARWASSFVSLESELLVQMSFEEQVRKTSNVLSNLSETYYKDFLRVFYRISKECKCNHIPDSLGQILGHCRDTWMKENEALTELLYDELVVLRNSVSHSTTEINIPACTVSFIDQNGRQIGPMGMVEYTMWYTAYLDKMLNLNVVFRIVFRSYWMLLQIANC